MTRILATLALLSTLAACSESVSPRAERVFYRGDGAASWGTVCELNRRGFLGLGRRGYISVAHVTENGTPLVGPTDAVTASDAVSDWSFLGIDPAKLDAEDYPAPRAGMALSIHGYPARDRDGEIVPGIAYLDDPVPPFWWIELHDSDKGIAAEGVIGGFSGSCVFDEEDALVAVVHANGFSAIGGTTNTFAKVVPVRAAILEAQGKGARQTAPVAPPPAPYVEPSVAADPYPLFVLDPPPAPPPLILQAPAYAVDPLPAPPPVIVRPVLTPVQPRTNMAATRGWVF